MLTYNWICCCLKAVTLSLISTESKKETNLDREGNDNLLRQTEFRLFWREKRLLKEHRNTFCFFFFFSGTNNPHFTVRTNYIFVKGFSEYFTATCDELT